MLADEPCDIQVADPASAARLRCARPYVPREPAQPGKGGTRRHDVLDHHRGWSEAGDGLDVTWCLVSRFEGGRIKDVTNFCADQHAADRFFWSVYPLKPIPDRLARECRGTGASFPDGGRTSGHTAVASGSRGERVPDADIGPARGLCDALRA